MLSALCRFITLCIQIALLHNNNNNNNNNNNDDDDDDGDQDDDIIKKIINLIKFILKNGTFTLVFRLLLVDSLLINTL